MNEKYWGGSYHLVEIYNERPVYKVCFLLSTNIFDSEYDAYYFQRNGLTDHGKEAYLYHNKGHNAWFLAAGSNFKAKNDKCWLYLSSSGEK